jgi:hypothetical protein
MWNRRGARPLSVGVVVAALLVVIPNAFAKPAPPAGQLPANGVKVATLPLFTWKPVASAAKYEFAVSSDKRFTNAAAGNSAYETQNTAASLDTALRSGTYWWHVRSVTKTGQRSSWTTPRSFTVAFAPVTNILGPTTGTAFQIPPASLTDSVVLRWAPMPNAANYNVSIASDALMSQLVSGGGGGVDTVDGTSDTIWDKLPDGTYYWTVTPLDAEGNPGIPSPMRSFTIAWQSTAASPTAIDLVGGDTQASPAFSWGSVYGASKYELEVSTSSVFASSGKVCCDVPTSSTSYTPVNLLSDNQYFWRVRPYDVHGVPGAWSVGNPFTTTFDNVPPLVGDSIANVHLRDMSDTGGNSMKDPVVEWDPVMGASYYEIVLYPWVTVNSDSYCDQSNPALDANTVAPSWSILGAPQGSPPPFGSAGPKGSIGDFTTYSAFCVRIRAADTDASGATTFGDWTDVNGLTSPMFDLQTGATPTTSPGCNATGAGGTYRSWLCPSDYVEPAQGATFTSTPTLFVWKHLQNAVGYYIVVARDPSFTNILDYAFTFEPAYAPGTTTYTDENSPIYWAVLPVYGDGSIYQPASLLKTQGNPRQFTKQSIAPTMTAVSATGLGVSFQWTPAIGAAYYNLQVASDPTYTNLLEDITTDSPAYTAAKTYPAGQTLYYRVRSVDWNGLPTVWATGSFSRSLASPAPVAPTGDINPASLDGVPTWAWSPVAGAVSYDLHVDYPDGSVKDDAGIQPTLITWEKLDGMGVWTWKVRAEFPATGGSTVPGPWSAPQSFTRLFGAPTGRRSVVTKSRVLLSWLSKQGAKQYHLQVATSPDFTNLVDDLSQDGTSFAPTLAEAAFQHGGKLLWRVATVDAEGNQSVWSPVQSVVLAQGMKVTANKKPALNAATVIRIKVVDTKGKPVKNVTVRVAGAGTTPRAKLTNAKGIVVIGVKPTESGNVTFRATKAGYQLATIVDKV